MKRVITALLPAAAFLIFYVSGAECVFRKIFGVICPGCGMTSAVRALFSANFAGAAQCHPMVFSLPVVLLYIYKNGKALGCRAADLIVLSALGSGYLLNYLLKIF